MFAYSAGFKTSVSMEPMLAGASDAVDTVLAVDQYVADTIWIGKMNRMRLRVDMSIPENAEAVQKIERQQSDREIVKLYNYCKGHQKIMWKDSVKEVLVRQKER